MQVPGKGGPTTISADESPRKDTSPQTLAKLKPVFRKDGGTVTAGNAPGLNDGSSALVVASLAFAKAHGLKPMAKVTGYATGGGEPREIFFAPVLAVRNLMEKTGTSIETTTSSRPTRPSRCRRWPMAASSDGTGTAST